MANGSESRVLDAVMNMSEGALDLVTTLDVQSVLLVRFAALVALDAPPLSYAAHFKAASGLGVTQAQVEDILLALLPLVGTARVVSAGSKIARAVGISVLGAEADLDQYPS